MTLNQHSSLSSKVKGHAANRKLIDGFLYIIHWVTTFWIPGKNYFFEPIPV